MPAGSSKRECDERAAMPEARSAEGSGMSRIAKTRRIVAAIALMCAPALANAQSASVIGNLRFAVDDGGVHVSDVRLGGLYPAGMYMSRLGVPMQATSTLGAIANDVAALRTDDDEPGLDGQASFVQAGGRVHTLGDASWRIKASGDTTFALLTAGDLVSTDDTVGYGFFGSTVTRPLSDRLSAEGLAGVQSFTDGNERVHLRAGLAWKVLPAYGVSVQWRWQQFESMRQDASTAYFNPTAYSQSEVAARFGGRWGSWTLTAGLGGGVETVNGGELRPVARAQLRGETALDDKLKLAVYAGYDHSASYGDAADNATRQVGVTLESPF
jgi:hypothetical protein